MLSYGRFLRPNHLWPKQLTLHIRTKSSSSRSSSKSSPPKSFTPSPEQHSIVKACAISNVMVSARPGSGKTTTVKAILQDNPRTSMVVLTYSKRLQLDTLESLKPYGFEDVYTFHGLAGKLFKTIVNNDKVLLDLRQKNARPVWKPTYDLVVLDELQDMTENLYWLTCVFLAAVSKNQARPPRLLCLGDPHQAIYEFKGADSRYLQHAEEVFKDVNPYPWVNQKLAKSFRLSHQTAAFVNSLITGTNYIEGSHDGPKPIYMHADLKDVESLIKTLQPLIQQHTPERCAIVAPSIRSNLYLPLLTNTLSKEFSIPVAVSYNDEAPLDSDVVHGKLVASTFHQFKGSERDLVIVYGFDASYFHYMGPELPDDRCPNPLYVAITRPNQQLVVIHHKGRSALPFISWKGMKDTCQYRNVADEEPRSQRPPGRPLRLGLVLPTKVAVTEMARHVSDTILNELVNTYLKIEKVKSARPKEKRIKFPEKVQTDEERNHYEAVSDLNGLAVTAAFEWATTSKCTTFGYKEPDKQPDIPKDALNKARWFAKEAARYDAEASKYESRLLQMGDHPFDWLRKGLEKAVNRLRRRLPEFSTLNFEHELSIPFSVNEGDTSSSFQKTEILGRADIVDYLPKSNEQPTIWEIKCTSTLSLEHVVQIATYGLMWYAKMAKQSKHPVPFPRLVLFNVKKGAEWEIKTTYDKAKALVEGVLRAKYTKAGETLTSDFLQHCNEIRWSVNRLSAAKAAKKKEKKKAKKKKKGDLGDTK